MYEPIFANLTVTARFLRDLILVVLSGSKKFFTLNYSLLSGLVRTARYLIIDKAEWYALLLPVHKGETTCFLHFFRRTDPNDQQNRLKDRKAKDCL